MKHVLCRFFKKIGFTFQKAVRFKKYLPAGVFNIILMFLAGCTPLNHYLIHPETDPPNVITKKEEVRRGDLLINLQWARPDGPGPFPGILVHPEAGKKSSDMRGVIRSLAEAGCLAVAADYQRFLDGKFQDTLFPFREEADALAAYELLRRHPDVDPQRIGALGFSQGGVFSILLAASAGKDIKAVVAYYPITDFVRWLDVSRYKDGIQKSIQRRIRAYFYEQSGAASNEEFESMLRRASPMYQTETLVSPVLLIHGENDTTAPVEYSELLYARLHELGRECKLMVVPAAPHVFNFRNKEQAAVAWKAALNWLDSKLKQ